MSLRKGYQGSGRVTNPKPPQGGSAEASPILLADLIPFDELATRLRLSAKTLKRLHRDAGLPAFRLIPHGPLFVLWPELDRWIRQRRQTLSTGQIRP